MAGVCLEIAEGAPGRQGGIREKTFEPRNDSEWFGMVRNGSDGWGLLFGIAADSRG